MVSIKLRQCSSKKIYIKINLLIFLKLMKNNEIFENFDKNKNNPFGFGWEFDEKKGKFTSVGSTSTLIFQLDDNLCKKNVNLLFYFNKYFKNQDNLKKIRIILNNQKEKMFFLMMNHILKSNYLKIVQKIILLN